MSPVLPSSGLEVHSTLFADGRLRIEMEMAPVRPPAAAEVLVRIEAAPVNPSDLMILAGSADLSQAEWYQSSAGLPVITAQLPARAIAVQSARVGRPATVGLEGAGTVLAAGSGAEHLIGRLVAFTNLGGGTFAQFATVAAAACVTLPGEITAAEGAAFFVNPMTALAMVETVRFEGRTSLIHTAAASSLGQMLVRLCREEGLELVNIVRSDEQVNLLRSLGATHICNSNSSDYFDRLVEAVLNTGARLAFDAVAGGHGADLLLKAMEQASVSTGEAHGPYGSSNAKTVYVYGHLDRSPMQLSYEGYGMIWSVTGWAMTAILQRIGAQRAAELQERIVRELKTTFATKYGAEVSLKDALSQDCVSAYASLGTGQKILIRPHL